MSRTLGDILKEGYASYIAPTKHVGNKEKELLKPEDYSEELSRQGYEKLNPLRRREIANESPLFMKGIRKKSLDSFRAWFILDTMKGKGKPIVADINAFESFELRSDIMGKLYEARVASHIYGDGYLLITFIEDKGTKLSSPPGNAEPYTVSVMNSEHINELLPNGNYKVTKNGIEQTIHKDRIIHVTANKIPGFGLGVSTIDLLRWTLFSKKNIDIAAGHILSWFAHGMVDLTWENMSPEQTKIAKAMLKSHPGYFYHDQDVKVEIKNPTAIDPKPFYEYVVLNIAAAINMPTHILTGIQTGRTTGSEIGFGDYYRDVHDDQEIQFTPLIRDLYSRILKARGRKWKYIIVWNPIYIDEAAEIEIAFKRTQTADLALNGTKGVGGFADLEEVRTMFNKGQIVLDPSKKIKPRAPPPLPKPLNPEPVNPNKPPALKTKPVGKENKKMIESWKEYKKKQIDDLEKEHFND